MKNDYKSIYNSIRKQIESFEIETGSLLPPESVMAGEWKVSRPTINKVYNQLQADGLVSKRRGYGTEVLKHKGKDLPLFGLLLPGAGESEIFTIINDRLLEKSSPNTYSCLCDGAGASNAKIRSYVLDACVEEYIKKGVDGVFYSPIERVENADRLNSEACRKIDEAGIPLVLIDRDIVNFPERSKYDLVSCDHYSAGFIMAQHLINQGCKKLYFYYRPFSAYSVQLRISAVSAAMRQAGLHMLPEDIICAETTETGVIKSGRFEKGSAIICANDSTAAMLLPLLEDAGYNIGEDLYICGFDDMKYAEHLKNPLTSYRQPCRLIADVAVELMFRRLQNRNAPAVTVTLPGDLIPRESSKVK